MRGHASAWSSSPMLGIPTPRIAATQARRKADGSSHYHRRFQMPSLHPDPPYVKPAPHPDNRFKALTSNCSDMPTLFLDTQAPIDVLTDAANYRIQAVTQVLEICPCVGRSSAIRSFSVTFHCSARFRCAMAVMCWKWCGGGCGLDLPDRNGLLWRGSLSNRRTVPLGCEAVASRRMR